MTILYLILFLISASVLEISFYILYRKYRKGNYYDLLYNFKFRQDIYNIIRTDIKIIIAIVFIFILLGCSVKTKYITIPLTKPPARYEIGIITNSQQALLEYRQATMFIARWQNWYNSNVGSNYYNYKDINNTNAESGQTPKDYTNEIRN